MRADLHANGAAPTMVGINPIFWFVSFLLTDFNNRGTGEMVGAYATLLALVLVDFKRMELLSALSQRALGEQPALAAADKHTEPL